MPEWPPRNGNLDSDRATDLGFASKVLRTRRNLAGSRQALRGKSGGNLALTSGGLDPRQQG